MRRRLLFISLVAALPSLMSAAEDTCPWVNSATASGALGHSVTASVTHPDKSKDDAVCEFTSRTAVPSVLRIEVTTMANALVDFPAWLARCGSNGTPVRGIGNQAVACGNEKGRNTSEEIISRIRDRALLVRVTVRNASAPRPPLREQASTIAEIVAGNLF